MSPSNRVLLTSTPDGALVTQDQRVHCRTPCYVRGSDLRFAEGFDFSLGPRSVVHVEPSLRFNRAVLGNAVFGGGIGLILDAIAGRVVVRPSHVHVEFDSALGGNPDDGSAEQHFP